jgi:hypothetical protein
MKETCCAFYFPVREWTATGDQYHTHSPYCNSFPFNFDHLVIISLHYCAVSSLFLFVAVRGIKKIFSIKKCVWRSRNESLGMHYFDHFLALYVLGKMLGKFYYNNNIAIIKNSLIENFHIFYDVRKKFDIRFWICFNELFFDVRFSYSPITSFFNP